MDTAFTNIDGDRVAFILESSEIKFSRFSSDILTLSQWLADQGLKAGDYVGILFKHPYWSWVAHLAAHRAGLQYATFTNELVDVRLKQIKDNLAAIVVDDADGVSGVADVKIMHVQANGMAPLDEQLKIKVKKTKAGAGSRLIFTSGTTGRAKLVKLDDATLARRVDHVAQIFGLGGEARLAPRMGMNAMPVFGGCLAVWNAGGAVIYGPVIGSVNQSNVVISSPDMLKMLLNMQETWVSASERKVLIAGGRLSKRLRDAALKSLSASIMIDYGASETNCVAAGDASILDRHVGAVGYSVGGAEVQVVDEQGNPKVDGEVGVIRTRSDGMVTQYQGDADAGAVFKDGWFYPGDLGLRMGDGLIAIVGRSSDVVNLGGNKLSLVDLEGRLASVSQIEDVCALTIKRNGEDTLAFAVVCGDQVDLNALREQVKAATGLRRSFLVVRVPQIPRNEMGKVPRNVLANRLGQALSAGQGQPN